MKKRIQNLGRYQKALLVIMALMAPVFTVIYALSDKVRWSYWFMGMFLCVVNTLGILFVQEIFRFELSFRIQDAKRAEPSDWEVDTWYISWTILTFVALAAFILGLMIA